VTDPSFQLPIGEENARLASRWLRLGVLALLASGVYSILLVLSRTPGVHEWIPLVDFFHVALVVHVDLSVVIWFLAFAGVFWSLNVNRAHSLWDNSALLLAALGTAVIAVSPFLGAARPLMNNYVPVLQDPVFYVGAWAAMAGFGLLVLRAVFASRSLGKPPTRPDVLRAGIYFSCFAAVVAALALSWSYWAVPSNLPPQTYFELLFWGAGHVLQLAYTLLVLVAWLWLADAAGLRVRLSARGGVNLMLVALVPVFVAPVIYVADDVTSSFHREAFTRLMQYGGLTALPLGGLVVLSLFDRDGPAGESRRYLRSALYSSLVLFGAGGIIGFLIHGVNVVIPAHYHGSIVGVTLAFMGLTYHLLPRLGFGAPMPRVAHIQPYIYGGGQLMHILGLAWSGGYGDIQRKTAGAAQGLDNLPEIAGMALMGLGGLISIIGGLLFLVVAIRSIWLPGRGD
jgi:cytochrome c oxidase subunit 1